MGSFELLFPALIILLLSCVQSVFGMGILVFGTPTFLLLGYSFSETLGLLLPASFIISVAQVALHKEYRPSVSKSLWVICLPAIGASLFISISADFVRSTYFLVACALFVAAAARMSPILKEKLRLIIQNNLAAYHLGMGVLHGMTNMGGSLLGVMAATVHKEKVFARYITAFYYLAFVAVQIIVVLVSEGTQVFENGILYAPIGLVVYLIVGNRLFRHVGNERFQSGMTGFLLLYAGILTLKWLEIL